MFELDGALLQLKYTGEQLRPLFQLPLAHLIPIQLFILKNIN